MSEILQVFPKVLHIRSFVGLDSQQPTQMAIIPSKASWVSFSGGAAFPYARWNTIVLAD
jgi:hypothetical protein